MIFLIVEDSELSMTSIILLSPFFEYNDEEIRAGLLNLLLVISCFICT